MRGERALEVGHTRRERRSQAKTDAIDALRAAPSVLGEAQPASPRAGGEREALRAPIATRSGALAVKKTGLSNCALRTALARQPTQAHPPTIAYISRRVSEGKTDVLPPVLTG